MNPCRYNTSVIGLHFAKFAQILLKLPFILFDLEHFLRIIWLKMEGNVWPPERRTPLSVSNVELLYASGLSVNA